MNEQIKELAKQSGVYFGATSKDYFGDEHPAFVTTDDMDIEKFAELLARRCIELILNGPEKTASYYTKEAASRVRQQFGIKE